MVNFIPDKNGYLKVETYRSGHFVFQIGLDIEKLKHLKDRVNDAHIRFISIPLISEISGDLEKKVMLDSIYSTNTIEGGGLSYEETENVLALSEHTVKQQRDRRVTNLKYAYNFSEKIASKLFVSYEDKFKKAGKLVLPDDVVFDISEEIFLDLHELITKDLDDNFNKPRLYRNNNKEQKTKVGHIDVGGVYQPPKCQDDIKMLMKAFCAWANSEPVQSLPQLYRAPLIHFYFELIHPFWDGNGRTGRLVEATVLRAAGYEYSPHAMSQYYLDNMNQYFTLLNICRKRTDKGETYPNSAFVSFFLKGMLSTTNRLHDRANTLLSSILIRARLEYLVSSKEISVRQHNILSNLIANKDIRSRDILKIQPWYKALYFNVTERTEMRDLKKLADLKLIELEKNGTIKIVMLHSKVNLAEHPHANISE
ncbi:MAG: Fic family protein [Methylococcaceae bacterium]